MTRSTARRSLVFLLAAAAAATSCSSSSSPRSSEAPGQSVTISVAADFAPGATLVDAYSGATVTVSAGGTVTVVPDASGVVLLEPDGATTTPFRWKNALVYFVMTDRFANGDPSNDQAFPARKPDQADEVGTWHGGDLAGLLARLDHVEALGATAIWITSPVEQVHGWVSGGSGDFKHYGYHGYWAMDFTRIDPNLGTTTDLHALVDGAHQRGIRVLLDVVMNHPGYATGDDLVECLSTVFWDRTGAAFEASYSGTVPPAGKTWNGWNDLVNYGSPSWASWWSPAWIRAGLGGGYTPGGTDDLTRSLSFLPDFKTESTAAVAVPPFFAGCKAGRTGVAPETGFTVRDYLVSWHAGWVREYGVDGFRCDTAKNVDLASWAALKAAATTALAGWKAANPAGKPDDAPFWMTGEAFGHGPLKDAYYSDGGFDSLLNFAFQPALASLLLNRPSLAAAGVTDLDPIYSSIATLTAADPAFDVLSYLSSHDTELFYARLGYDAGRQRQAATALLLAPGGVQVFYGDETGRRRGPAGSDELQGTRSDMNWSSVDAPLLAHWRKLGTFRKRHAAVGAGAHVRLPSPDGTYAFARRLADGPVNDRVVVILTPPR